MQKDWLYTSALSWEYTFEPFKFILSEDERQIYMLFESFILCVKKDCPFTEQSFSFFKGITPPAKQAFQTLFLLKILIK